MAEGDAKLEIRSAESPPAVTPKVSGAAGSSHRARGSTTKAGSPARFCVGVMGGRRGSLW